MLALSPSKVRSYQKCPLQFQLQAAPWPEGSGPGPSHELSLDRALHDALDRYSSESLRGKNPDAERLAHLLRGAWPGEAFPTAEDSDAALALAQDRLTRFHAVQAASSARIAQAKTFVSGVAADVKVNSVVDRVDRLPGGELELIDFKSGKPPRPDFDLHRDLGSVLVALVAGRDPKLARLGPVQRFTLWYVQNQQRVSAIFTAEDFAWAETQVAAAARGIERGEFPARRGPQCGWCEQLPRCPAWPQKPRELANEDESTFSRRLRASYSKLSLYKSCPRSYSKVYVEKLQTERKPFFDLGTAVHETLEGFHAADWPGAEDEAALLDHYEACFQNHLSGYRTDDEKRRYHDKGREMLASYHRHFVAPHGRRVAYKIEEYFELPLGERTVMTGFIDRIDRDEQGRLTVWDYKTESGQRTQQEVDEDLQLGIYAWACRRVYGQDVELGLFMLAHDGVMTTRRSADELLQVEQKVDELARRIGGDTEFAPTLNKHCPDCDWLHDCPLRPEVESRLSEGALLPAGFAEG